MPYIDVDAIQQTIQEIKKEFAPNYRPVLEVAAHLISQAPIADVVVVRHGEWIKKEDGHCVCSECGRTRPYNNHAHSIENWVCNYCHWCGVKMDGGKS